MPSLVAREDFLLGAGDPFGAQKRFSFVEIASGLGQGALAIHEARVGFLAELFDELRTRFPW